MGNRRNMITRLVAALVAALAALAYAGHAEGVVTADPMERPSDGWIGAFNGSSCVAVGPYWFVSAKHVGGVVGGYVVMRGIWYRVVEIDEHPTYDVELIRVAEELPGYHHLAEQASLGDPCVLGGLGVTAGAPLPDGSGFDWGGPHEETWGANTIEGDGLMLSIRFDSPLSSYAVAHEAIFAVNDSGGGLFVYGSDGSLQLAGIAVSVMNWGSAQYGNSAFALSVQLFGNWMMPIVDPSQPVSSGVEAPRE